MYCPACGARNTDDARFCNQCGVRIASMPPVPPDAHAPVAVPATAPAITRPDPAAPIHRTAAQVPEVGPAPGVPYVRTQPAGYTPTVTESPAVAPPTHPFPAMGTGSSGIALPMSGPSPRTMTVAGVAIAVGGIAIGAIVAWRAMRHPAAAPPPPVPETTVSLVETPHQLVADGGTARNDGGSRRIARRASSSTTVASAHTDPPANNQANVTQPVVAPDPGAGDDDDAGATAPVVATTHATGSHPASTHAASAAATAAAARNAVAAAHAMVAAAHAGDDPNTQPHGPSVGGYAQGDPTDATGTMDPQAFSYVYRFHRAQIASCHSQVTRNGEVAGTMRVRVRLATDGTVRTTRVVEDNTHSAELATCVQAAVHAWRYPQPAGGEVEFDYNFAFGT